MKPALSDVTLVAATSVAVPATIAALRASMEQATFGRAILFTDQAPPELGCGDIEWRRIDPLRSRADYSRFMLQELANHVRTGHALCIQWDGFVLDGNAWDRHFLEYDYIGAVWPHFGDGHNVGNGGFSLRSARLLNECIKLPFDGTIVEDMVISRQFRPLLEKHGIRFAPEEVARRFSYERCPPLRTEFGFHGAFNLVRYLSSAEALHLFSTLEAGVLSRNEHLEILRWALVRGRWELAKTLLARLARAAPQWGP